MTKRNELDFSNLKNELTDMLKKMMSEFDTYYKNYLDLNEYDTLVKKIFGRVTWVNASLGIICKDITLEPVERLVEQNSRKATLSSLVMKQIPSLILEINSFLKKPLERPNDTSTEPYEKLEALCKESLKLLEKIKEPLESLLKESPVDEYKYDPDAPNNSK